MGRRFWGCWACLLGLLVAVNLPAETSGKRLKLLFLGDRGHHQPAARFAQLQPALERRGIEIQYTENVAELNDQRLAEFDGLIVYANIDEIAPAPAQALLDYVARGKGFIPLHCASYCFRNNADVVALIGGQFQRHGTGVFRVAPDPAVQSHPLVNGFRGFESWDETYVHTKHNERDRTVLEYRVDGSEREPWTWIRQHGQGRVFYTAWGHDERTWSHPGFQNLVERGIRWACGDDPGVVPAYADRPEMTPLRQDLPPFEYVEANVPFYPPGQRWGTVTTGKRQMQLPVPPEISQQHMATPVDFRIELFAAEPLLAGKPLCMNWDERGRLWVCESYDYPNELQPPGQGRDRIRILEDSDGDGRADKSTVFAEQLSIPTALNFYRGGAVVQDGNETVYLLDQNGDDKVDLRKVLITGWGISDTHGGVSNFQYGLDNWYCAMQGYNPSQPVFDDGRKKSVGFKQGFFRFKMAGQGAETVVEELEFLRSTNNNTWGLGISEEGLIFGSTANGNPSEFMSIPNRYYESVRGWSSSVLEGIADSNAFEALDPQRVRQVDHHGGFTAAAGHALYTARNYPPEYWNRTAFVTEPTGHLIATFVLRPEGASFKSKNSWNLVASNDEWTAPIMAEVGPDGNVWFIDWYNFIVQHNPTPAGFRTGKGNAYESELRDKKHGRIYRVVYTKAKPESGQRPAGSLSSTADAIAALKSDNFFWRRQAQRLLVEQRPVDYQLDSLIALVDDRTVDAVGLNTSAIHALWTLHGLGKLDGGHAAATAAAQRALEHPAAAVRRNATAVLPRSQESAVAIARLSLRDPDAQVRLAGLLACAECPAAPEVSREVAAALTRPENIGDRWLRDGMLAAAARNDAGFLRMVNQLAGTDSRYDEPAREVITRVAEHYARGKPSDDLGDLLAGLAAKPSPAVASIVAGIAAGWPKDQPVPLSNDLEESLVKLVQQSESAARASLVSLGARWGSKRLETQVAEIAATFLKQAEQQDANDTARIAAARQLIEFRRQDLASAVSLLDLISPRSSPALGVGLIESVGQSEAAAVGQTLAQRLGALTPVTRAAALRVLLSRADWTGELMGALASGAVPIGELSLDQKTALANHPNKEIAERAKVLLSMGGGLPNPDRQKVVEEMLPLTRQTGDAVAGKAVFTKTCAKCHTHSGEGTKIGPDLTGMAVHPKHELLIHIIDPSRSVEGNFRIYSVVTDDGRVYSGLLASETRTAIELIDSEAKRHTLLRENIEELVASNKSLMPEGFEKQHTTQELADLLEFLTQRGKFLPLPLSKAATVVTTKGMFNSETAAVERLVFRDWGPKTFEGVPFILVDPQGDRVANAIMLHGDHGTIPPRMPRAVTLPCNSVARAIHFLSGVSGWGFPAEPKGGVSMTVRLKYEDGQIENHPLINGEHFADYIRRVDVPGSTFAFDLRGRQLRYLTVVPQRPAKIESIDLIKGSDRTAPVVMAVTVESP